VATCGTCGRSWDDGAVTAWTPAPSARCPFEAFHGDGPESWHDLRPSYVHELAGDVADALSGPAAASSADFVAWERIRNAGTAELLELVQYAGEPSAVLEAAREELARRIDATTPG
jgi:hypothetical protein